MCELWLRNTKQYPVFLFARYRTLLHAWAVVSEYKKVFGYTYGDMEPDYSTVDAHS